MTERHAPRVGGLDGCRDGWVLVTASAEGGGTTTVERITDLRRVTGALESGELAVAAIDIPIGLPALGSRSCDIEARRRIRARRNSVFPAPVRGILGAATYEEARSLSRSIQGKGISRQLFAILPKIREVDALMMPELQRCFVEVHPEVSFTVLADGIPMSHHKAKDEGRAERLTALRRFFADIDVHTAVRIPGTRPDDVLDAYAATWSAQRYFRRTNERLGGDLDERGLWMEIVA